VIETIPENKNISLSIKPFTINTTNNNIGKTLADLVKWSIVELKKNTYNNNKHVQNFILNK